MSDKPVAERLQVKTGRRLAVLNASPALEQAIGATESRADVSAADVVLLATPNRAALQADLPKTLGQANQSSILWVAYPKLTSPLASDLNRDAIRAMVADFGLDTVAQIAIDADWSAMRLKRV
jgi:hypothetical protein